ncbi:hypothetical protein [Thioclava kandeliae]|uniref:Uncharacterized protein n=1 Tax=Thioclava kandeliae TaxID=3070818 RepID=A0ABV1SN82_9RHOB
MNIEKVMSPSPIEDYKSLVSEILSDMEKNGFINPEGYGETLLEFIHSVIKDMDPEDLEEDNCAQPNEEKIDRIYEVGNVIYAASLF